MNTNYEVLYTKKPSGRYKVWGNVESGWIGQLGKGDPMKAGTHRLMYCPENGITRTTTLIEPDRASLLAAAAEAQWAMEQAIAEKAKSSPRATSGVVSWTPKQQAIIAKFRDDMAKEGALVPDYWQSSTAYEIAQAGIGAIFSAIFSS